MVSLTQVHVGLDYHQDSVQVCVLSISGEQLLNRAVSNDWASIASCVPRSSYRVSSAAVEACSGAADLAHELRRHVGWPIELAHPGYVARIKQSPDKSDFSDARLLADLCRVGYLPKVWLAPEALRQLKRLVRFRQQLVADRRRCKQRIRAVLREQRKKPPRGLNPWTQAWCHWALHQADLSDESRWIMSQHFRYLAEVSQAVRDTEKQLQAWVDEDPLMQMLLEMRGIGLVTAVTLRAEIGDVTRFRSGKQLSRYCGLSPRNASSGTRQADAGLIKAGNRELRSTLIEAGQRLMWDLDGPWALLACRLKAQGKPHNVIVAAVANRWVRWLYHRLVEFTQTDSSLTKQEQAA
jgi:transposase